MNVAILALQGAFAEHRHILSQLGVETTFIRNLTDWEVYISKIETTDEARLIIPGGESTAMIRIIHDEALYEPIRKAILDGMPVLGTCAGLIMLDKEHLNTMDIVVRRNAYGRQLGSFVCDAEIKTTAGKQTIPMVYIRAPYIENVGNNVEVLAVVDQHIVAARQGRQIVTAFHPELTANTLVHEMFLSI